MALHRSRVSALLVAQLLYGAYGLVTFGVASLAGASINGQGLFTNYIGIVVTMLGTQTMAENARNLQRP